MKDVSAPTRTDSATSNSKIKSQIDGGSDIQVASGVTPGLGAVSSEGPSRRLHPHKNNSVDVSGSDTETFAGGCRR